MRRALATDGLGAAFPLLPSGGPLASSSRNQNSASSPLISRRRSSSSGVVLIRSVMSAAAQRSFRSSLRGARGGEGSPVDSGAEGPFACHPESTRGLGAPPGFTPQRCCRTPPARSARGRSGPSCSVGSRRCCGGKDRRILACGGETPNRRAGGHSRRTELEFSGLEVSSSPPDCVSARPG
jgi:hypothetical protein